MPFARIVASNPSAARYAARTLHEAGYEVEIVPPGTAANPSAELVFDVDADKMLSISKEDYVPGAREFVLKPLWRKFTARKKADQDVARAMQAYPQRATTRKQEVRPAPGPVGSPAVPDQSDDSAIHARQAAEAAMLAEKQRSSAEEKRRIEAEESLRIEEAERVRGEQIARARAEQLRVQQEQESIRQRELEAQRTELRRQQQARELELARKRELEEREMIARKQEEESWRVEAMRREEELQAQAEAAHQRRLEEQRAEGLRSEAIQRKAEEVRRNEVMRQRHDEEAARKAEAQRLLLEANMRREESARERESMARPVVAEAAAKIPTLGQYLALRLQQWREVRAAKSRSKVTRIDQAGHSAWWQAWPITACVAAACLIGWGIAAYRDSAPASATQSQPPILSPGQYAPYPMAASANTAPVSSRSAHKVKRSAVRSGNIAEDEVVVHHYYPSKVATAQNQTPQHRKKISDLQ